MNFLESVGALTLIAGGLYYFLTNAEKSEAKRKETEKEYRIKKVKELEGMPLEDARRAALKESQLIQDAFNSRREAIEIVQRANNSHISEIHWNQIIQHDDTNPSFKKVIQEFMLPYRIEYFKFKTNNEAIDKPLTYNDHNDDEHYSQTLTQFFLNPDLKAPGYPDWFYAAFPDVATWLIVGKGNGPFHAKYSTYTVDELVDPDNTKQFSHKILTEVIESYLLAGNSLECQT